MIVVWVIYELGRNPKILGKLRDEIHAAYVDIAVTVLLAPNLMYATRLGDDVNALPTEAQLRGMKYLQNIIKEAMRMYHPCKFQFHPRAYVCTAR